jgi:ornithine cyclodeaminase/alanine dehydrogenase-like protein (mu-crystallin family)
MRSCRIRLLFDATGLAIQDLATAELVTRLARERGHGQGIQPG